MVFLKKQARSSRTGSEASTRISSIIHVYPLLPMTNKLGSFDVYKQRTAEINLNAQDYFLF